MQFKESGEIKNRADFRAQYADKRFLLRNEHNNVVFRYAAKIKGDGGRELKWEEALEHLIETHPIAKDLFQ